MWSLYQLLVLVIMWSSAKSVQHWAEQPSSTFVNPGGEVVLACRINNKGGDCRWEKKKENGVSVPVGIYAGKYEWAGRTEVGDCSLRIMEADFDYDNGRWVCQVTASGFKETDTLISNEAILSVRAPPKSVLLQKPEEASQLQAPLTGIAGEDVALQCIVKGGNPPPKLHWYVGETEVEGGLESENQEDQTVTSTIHIPVKKEDQQKIIRCVVEHEALQTEMEAATELDIQFSPEVSIKPTDASISALEDSTVNITCTAKANPMATTIWKDKGTGQTISYTSVLSLPNISRQQAGSYVCEASNIIGSSKSLETVIDVKFGATVLAVVPQGIVEKIYNTDVELTCQADGNPLPSYKWVHHTATGPVTRGHEKVLRIVRLDYKDQGEYSCEVTNEISSSRSEVILVNIQGPPRITSENKHIFLLEGSDATLEVEFCGSPIPKQTWQIDSVENKLTLVAGTSHDKYRVEKERKSDTNNCFISVLHILSTDQFDSKDYILKLENEHGEEIHKAHVTIGEELSKETLIGSVVGAAITFLLVLCVLICWCRKCCRSEKQLKQDPESINVCWTSESDVSTSTVGENKLMIDSFQDKIVKSSLTSDYSSFPEKLVTSEEFLSCYHNIRTVNASSTKPPTPVKSISGNISYSDLCFPKTSNFGSMRKEGKCDITTRLKRS